MKAPFCALILLMHSMAYATSDGCIASLEQLQSNSKAFSYILYLVDKGYLTAESIQKISQSPSISENDFEFRGANEIQKLALTHGLQSAIKDSALKNEWPALQEVIQAKLDLKKSKQKKVEAVKQETKSIWWEQPREVIWNGEVEYKHNKEGMFKFFTVEDKNIILTQDLNKKELIIIKPSGEEVRVPSVIFSTVRTTGNFFVGLTLSGKIKVFDSSGNVLFRQEIVEKNIEGFSSKKKLFSPNEFNITATYNSEKVLFSPQEQQNAGWGESASWGYNGEFIVFNFNNGKGKKLSFDEMSSFPLVTHDGQILSVVSENRVLKRSWWQILTRQSHLSHIHQTHIKIVDKENEKTIAEHDWKTSDVSYFKGELNSYFYFGSMNGDGALLYDANRKSFRKLGNVPYPLFIRTVYGSLTNELNEEIFYYRTREYEWELVLWNSATDEIKKYFLNRSLEYYRDAVVKKLKNGNHLVILYHENHITVFDSNNRLTDYKVPMTIHKLLGIEETDQAINVHVEAVKNGQYYHTMLQLMGPP